VEKLIAKKYGKTKIIRIPQDKEIFISVVPDVKHRTQLLSHAAIGTNEIWYIVCQALKTEGCSEVIRLVRVFIAPAFYEGFQRVLKSVAVEHFSWFYNVNVEMPSVEKFNVVSKAWKMNVEHFQHYRSISIILQNLIDENGPLLPARHIFLRIISFWNSVKAPTDKKSQVLKDLQPKIFKFGTISRLWIRLLLSAVYNAIKTYRMFALRENVSSGSIISLRHFRNMANRLGSFPLC
jgi:hypothetical protein